jgi:ankyrin repeat protein
MDEELTNAIHENNTIHIKDLIETGSDINTKDRNGNTLLIQAIKLGNIDMVKFLISKGADINIEGLYGFSPLTYAVIESKNKLIIQLLINSGININQQDSQGYTSFQRAIDFILYESDTDVYVDIINFLAELGANINEKDKNGYTPLMHAIKCGNLKFANLLIKLGANIDQQDEDGNTHLIKAVRGKKLSVLNTLIKLGAKVNLKNKNGKSAYSYSRCDPEILNVLKKAGAIEDNFSQDLLYLTHVTNLNNFSKMLESKKIYTSVDMWYRNNTIRGVSSGYWSPSSVLSQYPGVYMTLINEDLVGERMRFHRDPVCLVFCISLLDRQDFHYNDVDSLGCISTNLTSFNITELQNAIYKKCITKKNEVVFHHAVSLKYLKEIWVCDEKTDREVKDMLAKFSIDVPVKITNEYLDKSYTCDEPIKKLIPNYCFFHPEIDYDSTYDIELLKKLGKECGLTDIDDPGLIQSLLEQSIFLNKDITIKEIKDYLLSKSVSEDTIENLSEKQLNELKDMNLVGLNFLKNYYRLDGRKGMNKKSVGRKKSTSRRKKSTSRRNKSSRKIKVSRKKSFRKKSKSKRKYFL